MTIIYALSGIALNHIKHWNPSYSIIHEEMTLAVPQARPTKEQAVEMVSQVDGELKYKKHFYPQPGVMKIFVEGGSVVVNLASGRSMVEILERRPVLFEMNFLHYNPGKWWTWFSDLFAIAMMLLAISGLFIIKGKKGIKGRGAWLAGLGVLIPIVFLLFFR
jgi:hypothetical protein